MMTVEVLGTQYVIEDSDSVKDELLECSDGYCDHTIKKIVINTFKNTAASLNDLDEYRRQVVRHELVHAFLTESGLDGNSWAGNEEIVDWIALQFPKMLQAFVDTGAIDIHKYFEERGEEEICSNSY